MTLDEDCWYQIACGGGHTAGVTLSGDLYTWGHGGCGQLGHGNQNSINQPKQVTSLIGKKVVHVACGVEHTAVLTSEGESYTW